MKFSVFCEGTDMECQYQLMTFGISSRLLPVNQEGEINLTYHQEWLSNRRRLEASQSKDGNKLRRIHIPGPDDVLLGRGRLIQEHPGNVRFRFIVEEYRADYEAVPKLEKTYIAGRIVERIINSGGRFLKEDGIGWVEVEHATARAKVSHLFRNTRTPKGTKTTKQIESTETKRSNTIKSHVAVTGDCDDVSFGQKRARTAV